MLGIAVVGIMVGRTVGAILIGAFSTVRTGIRSSMLRGTVVRPSAVGIGTMADTGT